MNLYSAKSFATKLLLSFSIIMTVFITFLFVVAYNVGANITMLSVLFSSFLILFSSIILVLKKQSIIAKYIVSTVPAYTIFIVSIIGKQNAIFSDLFTYLIPRFSSIIYLMAPVIFFGLRDVKGLLISFFLLLILIFFFDFFHELAGVNINYFVKRTKFYYIFLGLFLFFYLIAMLSILFTQRNNYLFKNKLIKQNDLLNKDKEKIIKLNKKLKNINEEYYASNEELKQTNEELYALNENIEKKNEIIQKKQESLIKLNYKLTESEEKYRILFEKSDEAILLMDKDKFTDCNNATVKMLGYSTKEDFLNTHPSELSPQKQPDGQLSSDKAEDMIRLAYKNGTHKFEWIHTRANGENFPVEVWLTAIPYQSKRIIHTVWRDITEKKLAEKEIKEKNEELETVSEELRQNIEELLLKQQIIDEGKRKYDIIANNISDFIWMLDLNLKPQYLSPSCFNFLGYTEEELNNLSLKDIHDKKSFNIFKKALGDIIANNGINEKHFEVEYIHKNGHLFPAEVYGFIVYDNDIPIGIGGVSRNISEQKEVKFALEKSKIKIENAHNDILTNIKYAKKIQNSLLSSKTLIDTYLKEYFLLFRPKDQVSGDFYYIKKYKEHLIIAVADCTGHGVTGGFMTVLGITYLHEIVSDNTINNPADALNTLRKKIKDTFIAFGSENSNGIDIALCAINLKTNILTYAGAYNPLWIIRDNELIEYKATRNPIGFHPVEKSFFSVDIQLKNNDKIYLFSDGYQDQICVSTGKKMSRSKFKEMFLSIHKKDLKKQKEILEEQLEKRIGKYEQIDDVTIMGINWKM